MPIEQEAFFQAVSAQKTASVFDFDWEPHLISTDSRTIPPGGIFIPLRGENHDGHRFLKQSLEQGAHLAFCHTDFYQEHRSELADLPLILVSDTLYAYQMLARQWRRQMALPVVGITGSSGKTSTKELLAAVLAPFYKVHKNALNYNNQIGVPKTLLELTPEDQICLVEMGMRGLGQIDELARISEPNAGLISHIGTAHLSELGSQENIARAKWELAVYLQAHQGRLVAQSDDEWQRKMALTTPELHLLWCGGAPDSMVRLLNCDADEEGQTIVYQLPEGPPHSLRLCLPGEHQARNLMLCLGYLYSLGHTLPDHFEVVPEQLSGRNEQIHLPGEITVINDAYNANPDSMRAALQVLATLPAKGRKWAVLGKMAELGPDSEHFHAELGRYCQGLPLFGLCVIGEEAYPVAVSAKSSAAFEVHYFEGNAPCVEFLLEEMRPQDLIFFKGSRSARLEEVIAALVAAPQQALP
ncbi:MAG: UDP-N-acetylmuramoyl-tripeptide--D-alanyl-D-alanine ligase [Candidatus Sericytochromatia bacterium]